MIETDLTDSATQLLAGAIRGGICPPDRAFDRFLPPSLRQVSGQYWTPLLVAMRAAAWFEQLKIGTVIDIGSGAGKFCVAAALAGSARYIGIEQRPGLVAAARELARLFRVEERVEFRHTTAGPTSIPTGDAYYLYNPFGENLFVPEDHLEESVELGESRFRRDVAIVEDFLCVAPVGTYLVTYNGFGGRPPASYRKIGADLQLPNELRIWQKGWAPSLPTPETRGSR